MSFNRLSGVRIRNFCDWKIGYIKLTARANPSIYPQPTITHYEPTTDPHTHTSKVIFVLLCQGAFILLRMQHIFETICRNQMYETILLNCHCLELVSIRICSSEQFRYMIRMSLFPPLFSIYRPYIHPSTHMYIYKIRIGNTVYTSECPFKRSNVNTKIASKFFFKSICRNIIHNDFFSSYSHFAFYLYR